jgi:hypothetical protein
VLRKDAYSACLLDHACRNARMSSYNHMHMEQRLESQVSPVLGSRIPSISLKDLPAPNR